MLITNLTLVFRSDNQAVVGGYRGDTFWVYEITYDLGYDSCRSRRELSEYIKITPCCLEKSGTFMGSKIVFFVFLHQKGTYYQPISSDLTYDI